MTADLQARLQCALGDAYRVERELTRGGMSRLFLATEASLNRQVVVKLLPPDFTSQVSTERFKQEIELAAHLQHPNILPVLAAGTRDNLLYYIMPYVPGESLRHRLTQEGRLPIADATRILCEIADALACAHAEGIVHRDIKPENILLEGHHAVLTDFGVAHALGEARSGGRLTETGFALGTPGYMAPEQAVGDRQVDGRADVYAVAVVGYEMLAGAPPFEGSSAQAVLAAHLTATPRPLTDLRPETPPVVANAITQALAKDPNLRVTAAEFRNAMDSARGTDHSLRASRRVIGAAAAVLVVSLGAANFVIRSGGATNLDKNLLAVAPFDVLDRRLELWREGLVDVLARNLDGAGPIRTVPPTTVVRRWKGRADEVSGAELARSTRAGLVVLGSLVPAGGDSVRLRATLLDATDTRTMADLELRDETTRIDRLTDSLTLRLLAELGRTRRIELTRVASLGSTSLPALKAFLQGEQWFRRSAWDSALASYGRAVALDSAFSLALWRFGRVVGWQHTGADSVAVAMLLRAGRQNHGLTARDSLLVTVDSILASALPWTISLYRRLKATADEAVRRYPDDADAWHTLGEVYMHMGIERGETVASALAAFERAIALDSAYAPAYIHAIDLVSHTHGLDAARPYALHYVRRAPGDVTSEAIRLALDLSDPARARSAEVMARLERASASVLAKAFLATMGAVDSGEVAIRVARQLAATPEAEDPWLPARVRRDLLNQLLVYRGHLKEALKNWEPGGNGASSRLADFSLLSGKSPQGAGSYLAERLRAGDIERVQPGLLWWAGRRDSTAIRKYGRMADSLRQAGTDPGLREKAEYGVAAAQAYLELVRGDSAEALRRFESLPDTLCVSCHLDGVTRLLLQSARGQDRKVVETPWPHAWFPGAGEVVARREQALAAERLGQKEAAIRSYRFIVDAWRHADPELQPYVTEAQLALARLTSEPYP